ncbi:hypothetical protein [Halococcus hamelinensis]|uniref:Uncharacterized protein n=1 Tax=Halococcus hamelinensis 100A6 TaxID=1132509 RepID=M0LRT1_9EURY|nr:hypothetical protein [Halococcus hamelinensis]EMA35808.1 hypothetical protein C447_16669 [Halococcus hamelinensis 100A6]
MSALDRLYQPAYVGENRCFPCTTVNLGVALVLSTGLVLVVGGVLVPMAGLVVSIAVIHFRGYLVPGTPELTKRYLPDSVLRSFDKTPTTPASAAGNDGDGVDVERLLVAADALEPREDGSDLRLTGAFRDAWHERIGTRRSTAIDESHLANALGIPENAETRVMPDGDAFVATTATTLIAQWPSRTAALADVTAADVLDERLSGWERFEPARRADVLAALRIFLDRCPTCEGAIDTSEGHVSSCCRSFQVLTFSCTECGSRLYEMDLDRFEATAAE